MFVGRRHRSAETARSRLLGDQAIRPIADQRARLEILSRRLERAGRRTLTDQVAGRVKSNPRLMPVLQKLIRMTILD